MPGPFCRRDPLQGADRKSLWRKQNIQGQIGESESMRELVIESRERNPCLPSIFDRSLSGHKPCKPDRGLT